MSPASATGRRHWVEAWRHGVRSSPQAVGLVELASTSFIELSDRAANLLGIKRNDGPGLDYLSVAESPELAAQTFDLAAKGLLEAVQARRRFRLPEGLNVELWSCVRAIRSWKGPDLGLWVASETVPERVAVPEQPMETGLNLDRPFFEGRSDLPTTSMGLRVVINLDDRWHVEDITGGVEHAPEQSVEHLMGRQIVEVVHPDEVARLLWAFARATSGLPTDLSLRIRHGAHAWQCLHAKVTLTVRSSGPRFALSAMVRGGVAGFQSPPAWVELEDRLSRVTAQLERAAGALGAIPSAPDALAYPPLLDLPARQREIVTRLVRGDRVPAIAEAMYLSQSTVRNQLVAVFRKLGVSSQQELIRLARHADTVGLVDGDSITRTLNSRVGGPEHDHGKGQTGQGQAQR